MGAETSFTKGLFDFLSITGALLIWLAFFLMGVIARRYESVFQKWTGWKPLMAAPSGILVYVAIISAHLIAPMANESSQGLLDGVAYGCLLVSAVTCLALTERYRKVMLQLTTGPKEP